ncbi:V-type proton ATPase subunit S1 [Anthophora quadrimaculata]
MLRFHGVFCVILVLTVAFEISSIHADNAVPVLLWGGSVNSDLTISAVNPFLKTTSEEFDLFLRKKLENSPPVLLYVKDNLCIEDLVRHKQHLQKVVTGDSLRYFPAVEKAVNTLEDLPSYNQTYSDYVDSVSDGQLLIMPISNLDIIPETYKSIKDSTPNLVALLTGKSCTYRRSERVKRDSSGNDASKHFIVSSNRVLLYSSQPLSLKMGEKEIQLPLKPTVNDEPGTKKSASNLILLFNGTDANILKHKLVFMFEVKTAGYYTLKTANYSYYTSKNTSDNEQSLTTNVDIVFPFNFSYHCSQNVIFKKGSTVLNITDLQVQLDAKQIVNNTKTFNDAYDCVGFTTIPIWTGIFVTAILALIMIWGLAMIIDIRTMDRFDDPKGKTITISAQE